MAHAGEALFVPIDDGRWQPTELARGPWSVDALHGGPVAALLAGALEQAGGGELFPARLTVELLRPVPLAPLAVRAAVTRPGRKVQLVEGGLTTDDGTEVARATLLRIRRAAVDLPEQAQPPVPAGPETGRTIEWVDQDVAFHNSGVDQRYVGGLFGEPGPATVWLRLRVPVVPGQPPTPLQRVAAAADFGNGVSGIVDYQQVLFINPDLTVYLHRLPDGEWVCLDAVTYGSGDGVGMAESTLYDSQGRLGRSLQSLLFDRR
jgi:acyl-coenzyme A thioesterase PaaI-like protein